MEEKQSEVSICLAHSPSLEKRKIELELELKKEQYENEYNSCCVKGGKTDKRLIQYGSKFFISVLTMGFVFYQIFNAGECDSLLPWYTSIITMIMSVWIKPPKHANQPELGHT